jgi:hypothetical protein
LKNGLKNCARKESEGKLEFWSENTKNSFQFKMQKEFDAHIGVLCYHGLSRCELFSNKATARFARLRFIFTKILLQTDKLLIENINVNDSKSIEYHNLIESDLWKVTMIRELTDVKFGEARIEKSDEDVETTQHARFLTPCGQIDSQLRATIFLFFFKSSWFLKEHVNLHTYILILVCWLQTTL